MLFLMGKDVVLSGLVIAWTQISATPSRVRTERLVTLFDNNRCTSTSSLLAQCFDGPLYTETYEH